jgi:hypothetical protein
VLSVFWSADESGWRDVWPFVWCVRMASVLEVVAGIVVGDSNLLSSRLQNDTALSPVSQLVLLHARNACPVARCGALRWTGRADKCRRRVWTLRPPSGAAGQ